MMKTGDVVVKCGDDEVAGDCKGEDALQRASHEEEQRQAVRWATAAGEEVKYPRRRGAEGKSGDACNVCVCVLKLRRGKLLIKRRRDGGVRRIDLHGRHWRLAFPAEAVLGLLAIAAAVAVAVILMDLGGVAAVVVVVVVVAAVAVLVPAVAIAVAGCT
jgi:hypothetical protein